jgi:hypothetical protein
MNSVAYMFLLHTWHFCINATLAYMIGLAYGLPWGLVCMLGIMVVNAAFALNKV